MHLCPGTELDQSWPSTKLISFDTQDNPGMKGFLSLIYNKGMGS